jgi:hypothetical protein
MKDWLDDQKQHQNMASALRNPVDRAGGFSLCKGAAACASAEYVSRFASRYRRRSSCLDVR